MTTYFFGTSVQMPRHSATGGNIFDMRFGYFAWTECEACLKVAALMNLQAWRKAVQ